MDIVGFTAYNFAGCQVAAPWVIWETFDTAFKPYLDRMSAMAPGKPLFITQTGVLDKPVNGGVAAILDCFIFLWLSAAGAGPWSVDALRRRP